MWSMQKQVLAVIELGLFLLAIFLSIANMNVRYNTNKTTTKTHQVSLSDIEFPLKFSILINPGFAEEDLAKFGYDDLDDYFSGKFGNEDPGKDESMPVRYGWAGHTEYGRTFGTVSGINNKISFLGKFSHLQGFFRI